MFCAVGFFRFLLLRIEVTMSTERISILSQRMATITLMFLIIIILLNVAGWLFPVMISREGGYGFSFSLTAQFVKESAADLSLFPWWQIAGAIILTSIPLLALAFGLYHLRLLFQTYAKRAYFSATASIHLGKTGRSIAIWTLLNLICGPLLSIWGTMREPYEHRMVTFSFTPQDVMSLFIAACVMVIAHILKQASDLHEENQQFV
jgi:hypothetical protein